ncbi:kazrin [Notechis scutatus]|uniref:Kazrin n=1 Tax=Notechis scutatus TaxID=8663 RepID=A0A6J1VE10_9SAUR|nr:kazrin [Notechis scutatus]
MRRRLQRLSLPPCPPPQAKIAGMMEGNQQLALRIDGALQAAGQEVSALRAELGAASRRLAELSADGPPGAAEMAAGGGGPDPAQPSLQDLQSGRGLRSRAARPGALPAGRGIAARPVSRAEPEKRCLLRLFLANLAVGRETRWRGRAGSSGLGLTTPLLPSPPVQAKQSLATLTKDVPKRHSLAMPGETLLNGNQEWVMQADLPLTAAIRQSQQTLYHAHPQHTVDRQGVRVSPCHSRQPSIISDASAAEGDRSSTPSDINSPRHRTHSLCNGDSPGPVQKNLHNPIVQSLEDLEDQKRKKKKEKMGFGSISRVFARGKQRKSLDPGVFDGAAPDYYIEEDADW